MTREEVDAATYNESLGDGSTATLEVDTARCSDIVILIDNGATGGDPASHNVTVSSFNSEVDDWQVYAEETGVTDHSHEFSANGETMRVELTNQSGASATFRILVKSHRTMD